MHNNKIEEILKKISQGLDLSPTDNEKAKRAYSSISKHLEKGYYTGIRNGYKISMYSQGSMRLGTVVRPIKEGKDCDFDLDLVFELPSDKSLTTAYLLKSEVGKQIREHSLYSSKLEESRRCWTLSYDGFHMDILPSCRNNSSKSAIHITDKNNNEYTWKDSDPNGYAAWFESKNKEKEIMKFGNFESRQLMGSKGKGIVEKDEIPTYLIRTPLQRAIQIAKRHRDIHFSDNPENKPISMIITTLFAAFYKGENSIYETLKNISKKIFSYSFYLNWYTNDSRIKVANRKLEEDSDNEEFKILRRSDDEWYIPNPVNPNENFADKWHKDNDAKAKAFFEWVYAFYRDIKKLLSLVDGSVGLKELHENVSERWGKQVADSIYANDLAKFKNAQKSFNGFGIVTGVAPSGISIPKNTFYG